MPWVEYGPNALYHKELRIWMESSPSRDITDIVHIIQGLA